MLSKRGSSHVEIIMSFVLFVGFTFFLLTFIQPTDKNFLENSILLGLRDKFFENVTTNISETLVVIKGGNTCCKPKEMSNPSNCSFKKNSPPDNYYNFYSSNEFSTTITECNNENRYEIGHIKTQNVVSNKSLTSLHNMYYSDYESLRELLGVPEVADFAISAGDIIMERIIPDGVDVQAMLYRRPVLYSNTTIINTDFIFRVW